MGRLGPARTAGELAVPATLPEGVGTCAGRRGRGATKGRSVVAHASTRSPKGRSAQVAPLAGDPTSDRRAPDASDLHEARTFATVRRGGGPGGGSVALASNAAYGPGPRGRSKIGAGSGPPAASNANRVAHQIPGTVAVRLLDPPAVASDPGSLPHPTTTGAGEEPQLSTAWRGRRPRPPARRSDRHPAVTHPSYCRPREPQWPGKAASPPDKADPGAPA